MREYDVSPCASLPYADSPQLVHHSQFTTWANLPYASVRNMTCARTTTNVHVHITKRMHTAIIWRIDYGKPAYGEQAIWRTGHGEPAYGEMENGETM